MGGDGKGERRERGVENGEAREERRRGEEARGKGERGGVSATGRKKEEGAKEGNKKT